MFLLLLFGALAYGQDKISWTELSYEERQFLQQLESQWDAISVERQQRLRRGATRWQQMNPQQRSQTQDQQRRFQNLSPRQRQTVSRRFQRFNNLSRDQQRQFRSIQRHYRSLLQNSAGDFENNLRGALPAKGATVIPWCGRPLLPRRGVPFSEIIRLPDSCEVYSPRGQALVIG
ncbi:MAG: DUF3106 domain-containing protein [Proteobacteria bacterium]|nr:DUF3106 domain-containing protein [Pseudomonadota bacterium]